MKHKSVCSVGHAYFPHKLSYQGEFCFNFGLEYSYLVLNDEIFESVGKVKSKVVKAPRNPLVRFFHFLIHIIKNKTDIIEVYDTGLLTILYAVFSKVARKKLVIFIIGMELLPIERGEKESSLKRRVKQNCFFVSLKVADKIIYKELHMLPYLKKLKLFHKSHHLHNSVPLPLTNSIKKDIDISFVNTVRKMRHPLLFLEAIKLLRDSGLNFSCVMKGFHSISGDFSSVPDMDAEKQALDYINENNLGNCIEVLPFSESSRHYIARSKIFVLPSDVIYANYSLLEAMSFGCIPIVTRGDGAGKIIEHNVDGYICEFSAFDIYKVLYEILTSPESMSITSVKARTKIENNFSMDVWAEKISDIYNSGI